MLLDAPMETGDVRDWIDAIVAADKRLVGNPPPWRVANRSATQRIDQWLVSVDGKLVGAFVAIVVNPTSANQERYFNVNLCVWPSGWSKHACIWRVDVEPKTSRHVNKGRAARLAGVPGVEGPSYHSWATNRPLCKPTALPVQLDASQPLPENLMSYRAIMRWFFEQTCITITDEQMPKWPAQDRFI